MTDAERIAQLEKALSDMWHSHVEPFLTHPAFGDRFLELDRQIRALGIDVKRP